MAFAVRPIDVMERNLAAMRGGDREAGDVYRVRDGRIGEIGIFESDQYAVDQWFGAG